MKKIKNILKKILKSIGSNKDLNKLKLDEILNYKLTRLLKNNYYFDENKINSLEFLLKDLLGTSLVEGIKIIEHLMKLIT